MFTHHAQLRKAYDVVIIGAGGSLLSGTRPRRAQYCCS